MTAAGLVVLDSVQDRAFLEQVRTTASTCAKDCAPGAPLWPRRTARSRPVLGLSLSDDCADAVVSAALHEGLLLNAPQADCLRFTPALTVSKANIDEMLLRLARAFSRVRTAQLQCRKGIAV
jgi:acetylornithine/N-succinyldiaminopimelate aminotransferase